MANEWRKMRNGRMGSFFGGKIGRITKSTREFVRKVHHPLPLPFSTQSNFVVIQNELTRHWLIFEEK